MDFDLHNSIRRFYRTRLRVVRKTCRSTEEYSRRVFQYNYRIRTVTDSLCIAQGGQENSLIAFKRIKRGSSEYKYVKNVGYEIIA